MVSNLFDPCDSYVPTSILEVERSCITCGRVHTDCKTLCARMRRYISPSDALAMIAWEKGGDPVKTRGGEER